jgi:hypothetical protein
MITGAHLLIHSTDPDADRAFFRDVLQLRSVDAGQGWLIFALPPAEVGIHPAEEAPVRKHAGQNLAEAVLYLMCDDLGATMKLMESRKVSCTPIVRAEWGMATTIQLPSGAALGLYQPTHPTAI